MTKNNRKEKSQMYYDKKIEPSCSYCRSGTNIGYGEIACEKHGIMSEAQSCSAFKYEPTKRVPPPSAPPIINLELSEDDFSL